MGLGSYWGEVMEVLREIIPIYDKVNSIISLGKERTSDSWNHKQSIPRK